MEKLKQQIKPDEGPEIIVTMYWPDRGDGKPGWGHLNMRTHKTTPLTDEELEEIRRKTPWAVGV